MPVRHMYPLLAPEAVFSLSSRPETIWLLYTASPNQVPLLGPPISSDVQAQVCMQELGSKCSWSMAASAT